MIRTDYGHGLTVRQSLGDGSIGTDDAGHCISNATYPSLGARARKRGGFMQLQWFHIRSILGDPGCVCRSRRDRRITSVIQLLWWWLVYEEV